MGTTGLEGLPHCFAWSLAYAYLTFRPIKRRRLGWFTTVVFSLCSVIAEFIRALSRLEVTDNITGSTLCNRLVDSSLAVKQKLGNVSDYCENTIVFRIGSTAPRRGWVGTFKITVVINH